VTVSALLGFLLFGFLGVFYFERCIRKATKELVVKRRRKQKRVSYNKLRPNLEDIRGLFEDLLPVEFTFRPWYSKFWVKTLEMHPYLAFFGSAKGRSNYHSLKWLIFCGEVVTFVFIDSIIAPLAQADDSTCAAYSTPNTCNNVASIDIVNQLCEWNPQTKTCEYVPPSEAFYAVILTVLVIACVSKPVMMVLEYLLVRAVAPLRNKVEVDPRNSVRKLPETEVRNSREHHVTNSPQIPDVGVRDTVESTHVKEAKPGTRGREGVDVELGIRTSFVSAGLDGLDGSRRSEGIGSMGKVLLDATSESEEKPEHSEEHGDSLMVLPIDSKFPNPENKKKTSRVNVTPVRDEVMNFESVSDVVQSREVSAPSDNGEKVIFSAMQAISENMSPVVRAGDKLKSILNLNGCEAKKNQEIPGSPEYEPELRTGSVPDGNRNMAVLKMRALARLAVVPSGEVPLLTLQSKIMLAARLVLLQQHIDQGDASEELAKMFRVLEMNVKRDHLMGCIATLKLYRIVDKKIATDRSSQQTHEVRRRKLLNKLDQVRKKSNQMIQIMQSMDDDEEREMYLVRQFIVEAQQSFQKRIAFRHFFSLDTEEVVLVNRFTKYTAAFLLVAYFIGTLVYIFLTGVSQGPNVTNLWLQALALALCQDVFVLKPVGIWMNFIAISSIVADSVHNISILVNDRLQFVLHRTRGVLVANSLLVQHFNPACRAARAVPHLNSAKLLIALNDFDLPITIYPRYIWTIPFDLAYWVFFIIVVALITLPEILQGTIIESSVGFLFNTIVFLLLALQQTEGSYIAIAVVAFFILLVILREVYAEVKRRAIRRLEEVRNEKVRLYHERLQEELRIELEREAAAIARRSISLHPNDLHRALVNE